MYQSLRGDSREASAYQLRGVVVGRSIMIETGLEKLIEVELKGGEGCNLHDVDTIAPEEAIPTLLLPHIGEGLLNVKAPIFGCSHLTQNLESLKWARGGTRHSSRDCLND